MTKQKEEQQKTAGKAKADSCKEKYTAENKGKSSNGNKNESFPKEHDALKKQLEVLQDNIDKLNEKLTSEKNDYVRLMAEFETFRRRSAEERLNLVDSAAADTIKGLLPVLDDCERAIDILQKSSDEAAKEGTSLIYNKLMDYLKTKGLEVIEAKGQKFNTDLHEAVAQLPVDDESKKGLVYDVVLTGYTLNGKILRYAKVVVGI